MYLRIYISYLFFVKSLLGCLVVNNIFTPEVEFKNLVFQYAICYFISGNVCFTSRPTFNYLIVIADMIARVLKNSGVAQAVILDIPKIKKNTRFDILIFFTNLGYMAF